MWISIIFKKKQKLLRLFFGFEVLPFSSSKAKKYERRNTKETLFELCKVGYKNKEVLVPFYELFTGPAQQILDRWFESEILKTTLATDAVIGN